MSRTVSVVYLYNHACPSYAAGLARLREAAVLAGVEVAVTERLVASDDEAEALGFPGSPTYLVGGRDAAPHPEGVPLRADACRAYPLPDGRVGPVPHAGDLAAALAAAPPTEEAS